MDAMSLLYALHQILIQHSYQLATSIHQRQLSLQTWTKNFKKEILSYFQKNKHIIFCYRISREGISYRKQRITGCFEKAFFMYYLIENEDDLNKFLQKYSDNISNGMEGHFSWKIFCVPQEKCVTFLPRGIIETCNIFCICRLADVFDSRYWRTSHSENALQLEVMRYPVDLIAHQHGLVSESYHYIYSSYKKFLIEKSLIAD